MGDCVNIFLNAGKDALLPCDRSMCSIVEEQMATCYSPCMTARCDWSKSACSDQKELLGTCPFLDALVLESLEEHLSMKRLLADLLALSPADETFQPKCKVLQEQARHHHKEEEEHLFPKVRQLLDAASRRAIRLTSPGLDFQSAA